MGGHSRTQHDERAHRGKAQKARHKRSIPKARQSICRCAGSTTQHNKSDHRGKAQKYRTRSTPEHLPLRRFHSQERDCAQHVSAHWLSGEAATCSTGALCSSDITQCRVAVSQSLAVQSREDVRRRLPSGVRNPVCRESVCDASTPAHSRVSTFQRRAVWSEDSVARSAPSCMPPHCIRIYNNSDLGFSKTWVLVIYGEIQVFFRVFAVKMYRLAYERGSLCAKRARQHTRAFPRSRGALCCLKTASRGLHRPACRFISEFIAQTWVVVEYSKFIQGDCCDNVLIGV